MQSLLLIFLHILALAVGGEWGRGGGFFSNLVRVYEWLHALHFLRIDRRYLFYLLVRIVILIFISLHNHLLETEQSLNFKRSTGLLAEYKNTIESY